MTSSKITLLIPAGYTQTTQFLRKEAATAANIKSRV